MEKLGCRISRMKRDNTIEQLRGPKPTEDTIADYVSYGEMIPGSPKEGLSPHSEFFKVFDNDLKLSRNI